MIYILIQGFTLLETAATNYAFRAQLTSLNGTSFLRDLHMPGFLLVFPSGTTFHDCPLYKNGTLILQVLKTAFGEKSFGNKEVLSAKF